MIVPPLVWYSNRCIPSYPKYAQIAIFGYLNRPMLSIKREGKQACIIFGLHLHTCRKLRKCTNNVVLKLHACCPSRFVLKLGLSVYPNIALCALFGYGGRHRFEHQTRGATIMQHIWNQFAQLQKVEQMPQSCRFKVAWLLPLAFDAQTWSISVSKYCTLCVIWICR